MANDRTRGRRRGLTATMKAVKPYSREEKDFVRAFANALNHATAVVAADPDTSFPVGSIANRVQEAYERFRPDGHSAIRERARAQLSASNEQRQRSFGAYGNLDLDAWAHAEPGLGPELKRLLREAVRARLDAKRQEIAERLAIAAAIGLVAGPLPPAKTTLEIGYFGDVQAAWTTLTINAPTSWDLRWMTNAAGAERGVWQLVRSGKSGQQEVLLATGKAGDAPGGVFTIDLAQFLPSTPPKVPAVYLVRVTPGTKPTIGPGSEPGEMIPIPGKAVGPPSNDVVITYSAVVAPSVDFKIFEIYQTATFMLDSIYMVEDQSGPGTEEFHVAGFVQEDFPLGSSQPSAQRKFGPFYAELDPDGPRSKDLSHSEDFFLNDPASLEWPRLYSIVISVLEEDDGGALNDWQTHVWTIAQGMVGPEVDPAIRDYLEKQFKDYIGENIGEIISAGGNVAQAILALIDTTAAGIIGMVVAVAVLVIADIVAGMQDDYYGTEVYQFVLPTNITDYVNSIPGQPVAGGYQLETELLEFRGYTSWPEAANFDGVVDVFFHWVFRNKGQSVAV